MFNVKTLNKISASGLGQFDTAKYTYGDDIASPDAIMVRSASMHEMDFPASLKAVLQTSFRC